MADTADNKVDPPTETTTESEPKISSAEADSTTQPKTEDTEVMTEDTEAKTEDAGEKPTYTAMATNVASTGMAAATGVKDSVFSMFGGGEKKEKKDEPEEDEPSGSTKAKKDGEEGVRMHYSPTPTGAGAN
jgi:Ran-binding protein 1